MSLCDRELLMEECEKEILRHAYGLTASGAFTVAEARLIWMRVIQKMVHSAMLERQADLLAELINAGPGTERMNGPELPGKHAGAWTVKEAAAWAGIGENNLRTMAKNNQIPCAYFIGRRILLPRHGFMEWFNQRGRRV